MKFEYRTLDFPADYDDPVAATLLRASSPAQDTRRAVLYVHGYIDYFFQEHLAEAFVAHGYRFYAVELRKYGRSLREGQHPDFARSMYEYYPDLTESIRHIREEGASGIVLLGHSTGGLLAALYADDGPQREAIRCVVLNSPFLEFNTTWFKKHVQIPLAALVSIVFPFAHKKNELSPLYARSVHKHYRGEWDFDTSLKPIEGIPLYFSTGTAYRGTGTGDEFRQIVFRENVERRVVRVRFGAECGGHTPSGAETGSMRYIRSCRRRHARPFPVAGSGKNRSVPDRVRVVGTNAWQTLKQAYGFIRPLMPFSLPGPAARPDKAFRNPTRPRRSCPKQG